MIDRTRTVTALTFFSIAITSRIPFTSKYLYHLDSGHFALALEKYDLTLHQPHPPGYILYILVGKFLHLFFKDANTVFIFISIFFSGLSVAFIYIFTEELWDRKTGILAGMIALSSPNLWFHGGVALSYPVECFFSILVAYSCWKTWKGEPKALWFSTVVLGVSGGFRQNTILFLFPLWLYSIRKTRLSKVACSMGVLALVSMSWLCIMVWSTGGLEAYVKAFRDLWIRTPGANSVFEHGWPSLLIFSKTLCTFLLYNVGAGMLVLIVSFYSIIREKRLKLLDREKALHILLWIIPAISFHLLIFINPGNPGYGLIFLPPFVILTAKSLVYITDDLLEKTKKNLYAIAASMLIVMNTLLFLIPHSSVSFREIKTHDQYLSIILSTLKEFDPKKTAIFSRDTIFYNYRQVMYYLPEYHAYQVLIDPAGRDENNLVFERKGVYPLRHWNFLPGNIESFAAIVLEGETEKYRKTDGLTVQEPTPGIYIVSGPSTLVHEIYPGIRQSAN